MRTPLDATGAGRRAQPGVRRLRWASCRSIAIEDLDTFELVYDETLDADGNLDVVQRVAVDDREARVLLDTYLLGDARSSGTVATELTRLASRL